MKRVILFVSAILLIHASFSIAGSESYVSATYVNKADKEVLTLYPDGTLYLKIRRQPADLDNPFMTLSGKYRMAGDDVTFELDGEGEAGGKIQGNTFVDNEGKVWQKEGTSEPPKMDLGIKKKSRLQW